MMHQTKKKCASSPLALPKVNWIEMESNSNPYLFVAAPLGERSPQIYRLSTTHNRISEYSMYDPLSPRTSQRFAFMNRVVSMANAVVRPFYRYILSVILYIAVDRITLWYYRGGMGVTCCADIYSSSFVRSTVVCWLFLKSTFNKDTFGQTRTRNPLALSQSF